MLVASLRAILRGGEGGIRTLDTVLPVYHISSVVLSATQPPLQKADLVYGTLGGVPVQKLFLLPRNLFGFQPVSRDNVQLFSV